MQNTLQDPKGRPLAPPPPRENNVEKENILKLFFSGKFRKARTLVVEHIGQITSSSSTTTFDATFEKKNGLFLCGDMVITDELIRSFIDSIRWTKIYFFYDDDRKIELIRGGEIYLDDQGDDLFTIRSVLDRINGVDEDML